MKFPIKIFFYRSLEGEVTLTLLFLVDLVGGLLALASESLAVLTSLMLDAFKSKVNSLGLTGPGLLLPGSVLSRRIGDPLRVSLILRIP